MNVPVVDAAVLAAAAVVAAAVVDVGAAAVPPNTEEVDVKPPNSDVPDN